MRVRWLVWPVLVLVVCGGLAQRQVAFGPVVSHRGMVAASHPLAAEAGIGILKKGGNAFDAAVAVTLAQGVLESDQSSGITGEGFGLFYQASTGQLKAIDWGTRVAVSPEFAKRVAEIDDPQSPVNLIAPGALAGMAEVVEKLGKLSLPEVLAPAIEFADQGVAVRETFRSAIERRADVFRQNPSTTRNFLIDGKAPLVGAVLRFPELAETMRRIAREGKDVLYKGEIAREILAFSREVGGLLTEEDMELASRPTWVEPLSTTYRGFTIYAVPPAAGGIPLIETMNILENYSLSELSEAERTHVFAETFKLVFLDMETYFGDPDIPNEQFRSKELAAKRKAQIKMSGTIPWNLPDPQPDRGGTTHLVVADSQGNIASVTNTRSGWGLARPVGNTGIFLHAGTRLLSSNPRHPMFAKPGKRLQKSITPVMVFDQARRPILALGASGGRTITHTNAQVLVNILTLGLNVQEAITAPRVSYSGAGAPLTVSFGFSAETVQALKRLGHRIEQGEAGGAQAIAIDPMTRAFFGGADPRRNGGAVGY